MGRPIAVYRSSLFGMWPLFLYVAVALWTVAFGNMFFGTHSEGMGIEFVFLSGLAAASGILPIILIIIAIYRIQLFEGGIRGYDYTGKYFSVKWEDMASTELADTMGLKYLKVLTHDPKIELWIPCFLNRKDEFSRQVMQYAGALHPLVQGLKEVT